MRALVAPGGALVWWHSQQNTDAAPAPRHHTNESRGAPRQIVTTTHVVGRETDREAEAYYQHCAVDHPDNEVAAELVRLQAAGIEGVTLSFVNFKDEPRVLR